MSIWLLVLLSVAAPPAMSARPLRDADLSRILANLEVLADSASLEHDPMHVRIYRVCEHGECDGAPSTCPKCEIFISVSEYGEYPIQRVYVLPKSYGWIFLGWGAQPSTDGPDDYVKFQLGMETESLDPETSWWHQWTYNVKVNYNSCVITSDD